MTDSASRPLHGDGDTTSSTPGVGPGSLRRDQWFRVAALSGAVTLPLVLAALSLADVAGSGGLNPGSSNAQLIDVFSDFRDRQLTAAALFVIAAVATLVFLGPLWQCVRVGSEALGVVAVGGGVAAAVLWVAWAGWSLTAVVAADFENADVARFLMVAGRRPDWA